MKFTQLSLEGAFLIEPELLQDHRGFFARTFCKNEFSAHKLNTEFVQCNISSNLKKGTLRGMHFQTAPHEEDKLVSCIKGAIFDVIVDLRPDSPNHKKWLSVELTAANRKLLYVPKGFAHGFQTLTDDTEVFYQISEFYHPESGTGVAWDDPELGIVWPLENPVISEKDKSYEKL